MKKAFTLIEILVVMSMIGIFVTLLITQVSRSRNVGSDVNKAGLVRSITGVLESYKAQEGNYPTSLSDSKISKFQSYTPAQIASVRYVGFDIDGVDSTCEAYSVSTEMNSSTSRELQHDDDRVISFSGGGVCKTPDDITSLAFKSCSDSKKNTSTCMFGKPLTILPTKAIEGDWIFDLSNLSQ